jgi:hypothetical protein
MSSLAVIRANVESRIPGALTVYERTQPETFLTGIPALDHQTGGIPKGALTQICAPAGVSSGKTTLLLSLLKHVTVNDQFCAVVDAGDCFDPASAAAAGVCLSRLLWVRCESGNRLKPLEQAFKAADILIQNGGFGVIALDLGNIEDRLLRKVPLTTWFRFARVVKNMPAAFMVVMTSPAAQSCAGLTLYLTPEGPQWSGAGSLPHGQLLSNLKFDFEIGRMHARKSVQGVALNFIASPQWA